MQLFEIAGVISTQNLAPAGNSPTALSYVQLPALGTNDGFDETITHVAIEVSGTYTGKLNINGTVDGVNWQVLGNYPVVNQVTGMQSEFIPSGQVGVFVVNVVGLYAIRVDAPAAVTGSAAVSINASASAVGSRVAINSTALGAQGASVPANASDVVVSAQPGMLVRATVLTSGASATLIYDNASAGSGTLIGEIPATPALGSVYSWQVPCTAGITVKGGAGNSGLEVVFD